MGTASRALAKELETFKSLLPTLTADEGRFALIADDKLLGVYDTYADALSEGYHVQGLKPFLVKQIATYEVIANFSRDLGVPCRTSAM